MAPISDSLSDALDELSGQIEAAEYFLKKQPGAGKAEVALSQELFSYDGNKDGQNWLGVTHDDEGNTRICVREYSDEQPGEYLDRDFSECKPITNYPVSIRIAISGYIPRLLDFAVAAERRVAEDAIEAANSIEQALARMSEVEDSQDEGHRGRANDQEGETCMICGEPADLECEECGEFFCSGSCERNHLHGCESSERVEPNR